MHEGSRPARMPVNGPGFTRRSPRQFPLHAYTFLRVPDTRSRAQASIVAEEVRTMRASVRPALSCAVALAACAAMTGALAQAPWNWPEKPQNLKVLPKDF